MMDRKEMLMLEDLENARKYSLKHGTVWAASNGNEIIWSDSRSQVNRPGFWICSIFEAGHRVEA